MNFAQCGTDALPVRASENKNAAVKDEKKKKKGSSVTLQTNSGWLGPVSRDETTAQGRETVEGIKVGAQWKTH